MTIHDIALNKLILSPPNVRRIGPAIGIDELAASITAIGLLQNLALRPSAKGKYEVVAVAYSSTSARGTRWCSTEHS